MFGALKKKLKDVIGKISDKFKEEKEEVRLAVVEEKSVEQEIKKELVAENVHEPEKISATEDEKAGLKDEDVYKLPVKESVIKPEDFEEERKSESEPETSKPDDVVQEKKEEDKIIELLDKKISASEGDEHISKEEESKDIEESIKQLTVKHDEILEEKEITPEISEETKEAVEKVGLEKPIEPEPVVGGMAKQIKEIDVQIKETIKPEIKGEEKKGFLGIVKKVTEKTLSVEEIDAVLKDIENALLENDVAIDVVEKICDEVRKELVGKTVKRGKAEEVIENALRTAVHSVLHHDSIDVDELIEKKDGPLLVLFLGFNGVGKTTTLAKIAHRFNKYHPVLAAGDTFRAASIEQLEEHGRNLGLDVVKHRYGADSAAVIFDAKKHAEAVGTKLVLADTAGRAHTNANLMDELKKVCRVNKPDLKILVLDSLTGNDIYEQSRLFDNAVGIDAIILSKADVYEKGGAALSAAYTTKKPILFIGTGQGYDDLKIFDADEIVKHLLG